MAERENGLGSVEGNHVGASSTGGASMESPYFVAQRACLSAVADRRVGRSGQRVNPRA